MSKMMASVAKISSQASAKEVATSSSEESDGESEGYDVYEDYDDIGGIHVESDSIMSRLQE